MRLTPAVTGAKIGVLHFGISEQLRARPAELDLAAFDNVRSVGQFQRNAGILLNEQNAHALLLINLPDDSEDLLDEHGGQP